VHAIYFAMFNGYGTIAIQTLDDIHNRATYEMYSELILVTSAVRNSLHANPSGQPNDGPMGLSVALTPSTTTVTTSVSKSMITNASFRTKKLPDDIPIQVQDLTMPQAPQQLASVTEETEPGSKESPCWMRPAKLLLGICGVVGCAEQIGIPKKNDRWIN